MEPMHSVNTTCMANRDNPLAPGTAMQLPTERHIEAVLDLNGCVRPRISEGGFIWQQHPV
jgi:hypothetical protein